MLNFTQNPNNSRPTLEQFHYEPLVISTRPPQQLPLTRKSQKKITKTVTKSGSKDKIKQNSRQGSFRQQNMPIYQEEDRERWTQGGKIQIFDRNLRKNQLAEEQRRIKAELKKQKVQKIRDLTYKQKDIRTKTLQLQKDQQNQIDQLKKLIQKERLQKTKNDKAYEQRLKQIERERLQLLKLQKKIQQNGVRKQKQFKQQLKVLQRQEYPINDRAKCHQDIRTVEQSGKQFQISESEANHQRNMLRQKQLQILHQQRERCLQNKPTLGYNPTIIPLLSRASYKIISTHISTLVELFIDDLLEEQVYILEEIELQQKLQKQKDKQKQIMIDYHQKLNQFVDEAERIESKAGRYHAMKFQDLYIPKRYGPAQTKHYTTQITPTLCSLTGMDSDSIEEIEGRRDRFIRFVGNFDQYKKSNITMFESVTEQLINEAIEKLASELDRGSNDFVEQVFRKQFQ